MIYHSTKYSKTIPKHTPKDYVQECSNPQYTHVVTSVDYGLDAVFSFKRLAKSHENKQSITGSLEISINKIPGTTIEGEGQINMTEWEKELFNTTTLEVFGDFSPEYKLPTTYEEAIEFYQNISSMAGTAEDLWPGAQIVRVHLTPIIHMCSDAEVMYNEISDGMLAEAVRVLDELQQLEVKVSGMMNSDLAVMFNPLRVNLNLYRVNLRNYTIGVKSQLQQILPLVRDASNPMGEDALNNLIINHETSQFAFDKSSNFLIDRKRELNAIRFLVETVQDSNVAVADFEKATDVAFIFGKDKLVLLTLNILSDTYNTQSFLDGNTVDEDNFWYNKADINGHVGSLLRSLKSFSEVNAEAADNGFMVKLDNFKEEPVVMSALLKGYLRSNEFINPPTPLAPIVQDIMPTGFKFQIMKANEFITRLNVSVTDVINSRTYATFKEVPTSIEAGGAITVTIDGLEPAHVYSLSVQYMTDLGTGPPSPSSALPFSTRPTSEPQELVATDISRLSIVTSWQPPAILAEALVPTDLLYKVTVQGSNGFGSIEITDKTELKLADPAPDAEFIIKVSTILNRDLQIGQMEETKNNYTKIQGLMDGMY